MKTAEAFLVKLPPLLCLFRKNIFFSRDEEMMLLRGREAFQHVGEHGGGDAVDLVKIVMQGN